MERTSPDNGWNPRSQENCDLQSIREKRRVKTKEAMASVVNDVGKG